ncbi:MAG: PH domain-containing protein, partial [Deltaproteobacteria bacterium]|nr:PH domain-containing protein [Deltaproteobacteria bacterium]
MRCPQCGFEATANSAFCSRCGTRVMTPRPETKHEYALTRILPSWWHYSRDLIIVTALFLGGLYLLSASRDNRLIGLALIALAFVLFGLVYLARRYTYWSLTSDRLIERRGIIAKRKREMELADMRSVEVSQRFFQRLIGLGDVTIASAASADYAIRLNDIRDPEPAAETI